MGSAVQWAAMGLSLAVEVPVAVALVRVWASRRANAPCEGSASSQPEAIVSAGSGAFSWPRVASVAAAGTLLTHPVVWWANTVGLNPLVSSTPRLAFLESFAVSVEAVVYAVGLRLGWRWALGVSLLANGASFAVGLLAVRAWRWWLLGH